MTFAELPEKRREFKAKVVALLKDPYMYSYTEIGEMCGVSRVRVCQIRIEMGLSPRCGGHHKRVRASANVAEQRSLITNAPSAQGVTLPPDPEGNGAEEVK